MVLCITHSRDFYTIDIVQQALEQSGFRSFRLNSDEFAVRYKLNYILNGDAQEMQLSAGTETITSSQVNAVWYRKLWKLSIPPELDPAYHDVFRKEYQTHLQIFFNSLDHVPWMNRMAADHAVGGDKLHQLTTANAAGLTIPHTIFTNKPEAIRQLYDDCNGNIVAKLHGALSRSMEGNTTFFPTTKISAAHLDRLNELAYCPMIFQEYIPKAYELRIAYVDGICFAGKIPADNSTDWRAPKGHPVQWQPYELPSAVGEQLSLMMQQLGLAFGAIDMIRRPDGTYVFLEVNPQGEWGMLQKCLGYPIGETIVQQLIKHIKNG